MALTRSQFAVLSRSLTAGGGSQRSLAAACGLSVGTVNAALRKLRQDGLLDAAGAPTEQGRRALEPYRVRNAVIMAAGMSTRFAPLSYERPKGVLRVRGEVLIERQIRQLQEVGITDITVVVGYMKEQFFYLEDAFGCKIVVNEEYAFRNNNSTLMLVAAQLGNTYICSSDNYFTHNVFEPYVYEAYYAATYFDGPTDEYLLDTGAHGRITGVRFGGEGGYAMLGHAYFDRPFAQRFCEILAAEYAHPDTAPKLWEDIFAAHVDELPMVMRPYDEGVVWEFDSLDELRGFDPSFIENVDSSILDHICVTLGCRRDQVSAIEPISQGLTNLSFRFAAPGGLYVYRHPGAGTDAIINRRAEAFSQEIAAQLGLDGTFIFEDADQGWKISRYLPDCEELDYHDSSHVEQAMALIRTLHGSGACSEFSFDVHQKTRALLELLDETRRASFPDFAALAQTIQDLADYLQAEGGPRCLCHNDFYSPNLLVAEGRMHLIDWEYSGMSDYASDLGTFICCSDYGYNEAVKVLALYFQRPPTTAELVHCIAYVALAAFYWFVWALYKDACGAPVGEWLYLWYRSAKLYGARARELLALQGGKTHGESR